VKEVSANEVIHSYSVAPAVIPQFRGTTGQRDAILEPGCPSLPARKGLQLSAPRSGATVSYEGTLPFRGKSVPIRLDIIDWEFKSRPEVRLLDRPEALRGFRPHLGIVQLFAILIANLLYGPVRSSKRHSRCLLEAESTLEELLATNIASTCTASFCPIGARLFSFR